MLKLIKDAYVLYLRNLPLIAVYALPLLVLSIIDAYISNTVLTTCIMVLMISLANAATDICLYRRLFHFKIINPLSNLRTFGLYLLFQICIGLIGTAPLFVLLPLLSGSGLSPEMNLSIAIAVNTLTFFTLMSRLEIILPLIVQNKLPSLREFWKYTNRPWNQWLLVALLIYFPYVVLNYALPSLWAAIIVTTLFSFVSLCFNIAYINNNRFIQNEPKSDHNNTLTPAPVKPARPAPAKKKTPAPKTPAKKAPAKKLPLKKPVSKKAPKKTTPRLKPVVA